MNDQYPGQPQGNATDFPASQPAWDSRSRYQHQTHSQPASQGNPAPTVTPAQASVQTPLQDSDVTDYPSFAEYQTPQTQAEPQFQQYQEPQQQQTQPLPQQQAPVQNFNIPKEPPSNDIFDENYTPENRAEALAQYEAMVAQGSLPDYLKPEKENVLFEWRALSRPYRKHNRRFFTTVATIAALITLIMFFSGQWQLAGVILSIGFLGYMMMVTPPHETGYKITTFGIHYEDQLYYWEQMGSFWFTTQYQSRVVNIETSVFPFRLQLVLGQVEESLMRELLEVVLVEETPLPTTYEKVTKWWQDKIPLDFES